MAKPTSGGARAPEPEQNESLTTSRDEFRARARLMLRDKMPDTEPTVPSRDEVIRAGYKGDGIDRIIEEAEILRSVYLELVNEAKGVQRTTYAVRAIPLVGHSRRMRAGRAWTTTPVSVVVAEKPDPKSSDPIQVTALQLEQLQKDPQIAVSIVGVDDLNVTEINEAKIKLARVSEELQSAKRELAEVSEEMKQLREKSRKDSEEAANKIAQLEADKASLQARITPKKAAE